jgi:hypothetical protein
LEKLLHQILSRVNFGGNKLTMDRKSNNNKFDPQLQSQVLAKVYKYILDISILHNKDADAVPNLGGGATAPAGDASNFEEQKPRYDTTGESAQDISVQLKCQSSEQEETSSPSAILNDGEITTANPPPKFSAPQPASVELKSEERNAVDGNEGDR